MILPDIEIQQKFPVFFKTTQSGFEALNAQADALLGFPTPDAQTYCKPIVDLNGDYWFLVNQEVSDLVDLSVCISFEEIHLFNEPQ